MKLRIIHILFLLFACAVVFAQEMRVVSGIIKDDNGEPIAGVTVQEKGSNNATMTDMSGYYEIRVPLGGKLEFRYIGMKTREMLVILENSKPYNNQTTVRQAVRTAPSGQITVKTEANIERRVREKIVPSRDDQSLSPYFLVKSNSPDEAWMPLKKTDVQVNIAGVIADVCVKQIYTNESKNILEAIYVFPGSTRAAVYAMAMTIGDRRIEAQIKKKEQARLEYEQAKQEGKSTTLLEQHRPNVFQMNVANILPGDTITVEMRYTELLENQGGMYEFVYPTVVGPRYSETGEDWVNRSIDYFESSKTPEFSIKTIIQAGMPLQKVSSVSHNLIIESSSPDQAIISLSNPKDYEGNRDYILQYGLQGGKVESGLLRYEHGDKNFFLLMMQPPKKPTLEQIPSREYVFIIDVSGSMHGFPISVSKELIRNLVSELRPADRFNVMLFESSNAMLYKESVPATKENIEKALNVIDNQRGNGGTRLYPAIENAMNFKGTKGFSRTFIVITDGFVTVEQEAFNYIRSNLNKANLFPFGIGSSVNRYLIEGLANAGMGTPYIVTNLTQAEEIGKKAIKEISQPVLTNISIDWGDFDVYDVEPVAIPDVFAERPILVYGKYKSPADGTISVSGISGNSIYEQKFDVVKARKEHNQALRYLWARNKIRYYDDYAQYYEGESNSWNNYYGNHQKSAKQIETVTNLGLKYNLLTQYTSFLAVDQELRTPKSSSSQQIPTPKPSTPQETSTSDFQLSTNESALNEVVVTGFGAVEKRMMTGSSTTISASDASRSLQGRAAGVSVQNVSGTFGTAPKIRVRGASSIYGSSEPLWVVDGVIVENAVGVSSDQLSSGDAVNLISSSIAGLNADNIESFQILKDASATAIYGARAMNGVIVVTTKRNRSEQLSIALSSSFSVETPNKLPEKQSEYAQGRPEDGVPTWNTTDESFSWGPSASSVNAPTYDVFDILKTGYSLHNYLTISGKTKKNHYGIKIGNDTQHGIMPGSKFEKNSIRLKFGKWDTNKFGYDFHLDYKNTKEKQLQRGYNMSSIMQGTLLTPPTFDNSISTLPDGSQNAAGSAADNPYWNVKNNPFGDEANQLIASGSMLYKSNSNLTFNYQLNGNYLSNQAHSALNTGSVYMPSGHVMSRNEIFESLNSKLNASYKKYWDNFTLSAIVGHEFSASRRTIDRQDGYGLNQSGDYNIQSTDSIVPYNRLFKRYSNAFYGSAALGYRDILSLNTAMRGEWSSLNTTLLSPSAGLSINLREMFYYRPISHLRIFGKISNTDKDIPLYIDPVYFNSAVYNLNDASSHFESREVVLADNLKPEKIEHYEVGTEIGLFANRLSLKSSWYWRNGKNQLLPTQITESAVQLENIGTFKAHGFELEMSAQIVRNRDFSWRSDLVFSRERNKIVNLGGKTLILAGIEDVVGSYAIEGEPLGVLYGTVYERDEQGRLLIGDDGFPVKSDELKVIGNPNPDWALSWTNAFMYRRFSLSVQLDYKKGGDMWNGTRNAMNYYGTSQYSAEHRNTTNYVFDGVLSDGSKNDIPVDFYGNNLNENRWVRYGQYGVSEDGIEDGTYLKLREISLGYRLPLQISNRKTELKLSVFATNILLYSKYQGVDPETNLTGTSNGFGLDYFNIPGVQSVGISLNWGF